MRLAVAALFYLALCFAAFAAADPFHAAREFPNHFAALAAGDPALASKEVQETLLSLYQRVTLPLFDPASRTIRQARILPLVQEMARQIHPDLTIDISGGVLRSGLAYLYREGVLGLQQNPPVPFAQTLKRIKSGTEDIRALEALGLGSDFDLLIEGGTPQAQQTASKQIKARIDETSRHLGVKTLGDAETRLWLAVGDVKPYDEQIARASSQGGSSIDWMVLNTRSGKVKTPARDPGVWDRFLKGQYHIIPSQEGHLGDVTLVRAFRPLSELPFLQLTRESEALLKTELVRVLNTNTSGSLDSKAVQQFQKLTRNSFPAAANNRFFRAAPGSSEELFYKLAKKAGGRICFPSLPVSTRSL